MAKQGPEVETTSSVENLVWKFARTRGMDRRKFLRLMGAGGASAVLAACFEADASLETPTSNPATPDSPVNPSSPWFKDPEPFIRHGDKGLETRLENMQELITPHHHFFVRNNATSLNLNASEWRLVVEGDALSEPLELTYDQIKALPSRTLTCYLECAGNHRALFDIVHGRKAVGTQWMTGGISNGEWVGAALRDVLNLAGIQADAASVMLVGLDAESPEEGFRYVLPVAKAMHSDTLLAYGLNGETLPRDHGHPLRALVPGWVGSANIKWLGKVVVSREKLWTRNNTTSYVLIGDRYVPEGEAMGVPVTRQVIKSALALPWPAELPAGRHRLYGYAHSPSGSIARVEWSADGGRTWAEAELVANQRDYSWARFEFNWDAVVGEWTITTRAIDAAGNTQPAQVPFNEKGYLFNQPVPHPVRVG